MPDQPVIPEPEGREFGRRLSLAVREAGYSSILDVCEEVGISHESMRKYRTGKRLPTAPILIKLARVLGVTSGWLLGASALDEAHGIVRADKIERADKRRRANAIEKAAESDDADQSPQDAEVSN